MNNIDLIQNFLKNETDSSLIVNQVSDEIGILYRSIIDTFCKEIGIKIIKDENKEINNSNDLFRERSLNLYYANNKKIIEDILKEKTQSIIFTDYRIYKYFANNIASINGYNYQSDIKYYLKKIKKIDNSDVLTICTENPQLMLSEISKYQINSNEYVKEKKVNDKNNFILELRKEFYNLKRKNSDTKSLYENLKKEVKYKKFNFLTY